MAEPTVTAMCSGCGNRLPPNHTGTCPNCGKEGKAVSVVLAENVRVTARCQSTREFYEKNPTALWVVVILTVVSPMIGYFVTGLAGVLVGLILGVLSYYVGAIAVTKVREIRQG